MKDRAGVQIDIEGLTHRYNAKCPLTFEQLDMTSAPGESLVIIGRSGCGKSTLLHIIAGLLGGYKGAMRLNKQDVKNPSSSGS